jgi:putative transposase
MIKRDPFKYFKTSPEIIRLAVMMYVRFPLSLRNVEDFLYERGIDICHETVRFWWNRFGPLFTAVIRKKRFSQMRAYLKLAVALGPGVREDQRREALSLAGCRSRRGSPEKLCHKAPRSQGSLKLLRKTMKRHCRVDIFVTDKLLSYGAQ